MLWTRVATVAMLVVPLAFPAKAATLAMDFRDSTASGIQVSSQTTLGFSFRVLQDVIVDELGFRNADSFGSAVRLYDAFGTVLAATLVLPSDPRVGGLNFPFSMSPVTPVLLTAGNAYFISGVLSSGGVVTATVNAPVPHPSLEYLGPVWQSGVGVPRTNPQPPLFSPQNWTLVNFAIADPPPIEVEIPGVPSVPGPIQIPGGIGQPGMPIVPLPGTFVLLASGLLLLGRQGLRRRASAAAFITE